MEKLPELRQQAASRLRGLADRLEPPKHYDMRASRAIAIRLGGRWWSRDELTSAQRAP
jgi:hypothetical protein